MLEWVARSKRSLFLATMLVIVMEVIVVTLLVNLEHSWMDGRDPNKGATSVAQPV